MSKSRHYLAHLEQERVKNCTQGDSMASLEKSGRDY